MIRRGDVMVKNSPRLCHLHDTVDWAQVLHEELQAIKMSSAACSAVKASCDHSCGSKYCWGKNESDCQLSSCPPAFLHPALLNELFSHDPAVYRNSCAPQCIQNMCFKKNDSQACCHSSCAGGCTGYIYIDR